MNNETKILCDFCSLKDNCKREQRKRQYEESGWTTYCLLAKPIKEERGKFEKYKGFREEGRKNARRRRSNGSYNN